jgi:membrane associated rhomboid family serine protease
MMIGFMVEKNIQLASRDDPNFGLYFMLANFLIVQLGSAIFSCYVDDNYSIGADPLIFGYLGCIYAMFAHDFGRMGEFENALC